MTAASALRLAESETSFTEAFLPTVLAPYRDFCRHLKTAEYFGQPRMPSAEPAAICALDAAFDVQPSWYINATGHFNAVDAVICFNQAGYLCVANLLEDEAAEVEDRPSVRDFQSRMLPDMLIIKLDIQFRRPIQPPAVSGRFSITKVRKMRDKFISEACCVFTDGHGGEAQIDALIAFRR